MYSGVGDCNLVILLDSVLDGIAKRHMKVLPSPELLAVCYLLQKGEQQYVISQGHELVSFQLSFKKV